MKKQRIKDHQPGQKKSPYRFYILWLWTLLATGLLVVVLVFYLASRGLFGSLPSFEELENPRASLATEIYSSNGETLGKYFKENRTPVTYEDLPQNLINAIVATEDERFYHHSGIDAKGTLRAILYLGQKGGASTITQQLAKLLFTEKVADNAVRRILQKVKEWIIAVRLERQYTKEEILTMYLNKYDFIYQAVGIRSASNIYFGKEPKDLKTEEAAVLTAMLKNPSYYNPLKKAFKNNSFRRRNIVLHQMAKNGYLTSQERDSLQQLPLITQHSPQDHDEGIATYFRVYLQKYLLDWIENNPKPNGETYNLYQDGLKVYTTIDSRFQLSAETAVHNHLSNLQKELVRQNKNNKKAPFRDITVNQRERIIKNSMRRSERWRILSAQGRSDTEIVKTFDQKRRMTVFTWAGNKRKDTVMTPRDSILYYKSFLQSGVMSMTPQTGEVKAWVGGIDFKHFKFDHVVQGERQVGSTFKPFVYATAIDQLHVSPCQEFPRSKHTIKAGSHGLLEDWTPKNSGNNYEGMVTVKEALAQSVNTVTARLIDQTGTIPVLALLKKLGINIQNMPQSPSIALGSAEISVFDMVSAFSAFANQGIYVEPFIVSKIEDKHGTILYQHLPLTRDVISEEIAYVTLDLMKGVTESGSGTRLRTSWAREVPLYKKTMTGYPYEFENPIAGKTGTSQNQSDGWLIGMVPNLVTGVWVGAEDRSVHFPGIAYGQGATMALPIWGLYMKALYDNMTLGISKEDFQIPENLTINSGCEDSENLKATATDLPEELHF